MSHIIQVPYVCNLFNKPTRSKCCYLFTVQMKKTEIQRDQIIFQGHPARMIQMYSE